jgi:glycerophosphoryl diester phosphodiesterase
MHDRNPHPYLDHPGTLAFAHRGGTEAHPENSLAAFGHAVGLGYTYLETDVHATADGTVLAFHDVALDRVTDRSGRIAELSWSEVAEARIGGTEPIPLLADLFTAFPGVRINIDPKDDRVVDPLVEILKEHDALDRVCLGSFSDRRLRRCRTLLGPGLCTSAGPLAVARVRLSSLGLPTGRPAAHCLQVPVRQGGIPLVDRRFVDHAHARGMQVHVWTIDDPAEMHRLLDLGVDGLMTDQPSLLRSVLIDREDWVA